MLNSFLLAGFFLGLTNALPVNIGGVPIAHATPAARTAVKHSAQFLGTAMPGSTAKFLAPSLADPAGGGAIHPEAADGLRPEEREFIQRINAERTARGLNALLPDALLTTVAREHSREMCDLNYFDHHSPTPGLTTPMDRYLTGLHTQGDPTPPYLLVGENIYYCSVTNSQYNVQYGHEAFMHSPGHRANILEPRFMRVGVGVYEDAGGQFWVTELFLNDQN